MTAASSVYDTEPVGLVLDQPDFLNACLRIETALHPEGLLDACKAVERTVGRAAGGPRHGPRVIDVDVLLLDDLVHNSDRLTLPHPEVARGVLCSYPCSSSTPNSGCPAATASRPAAWLGPGQEVRRAGPALM